MGELKKYQIRATRRPAKNPLVSSVVLVRNEQGRNGYCYINFAPAFVAKVGKVLSRGVSEFDPAFVSVRFYPRTQQWLLIAQYVRSSEEALLWRTAEKPAWLNFYEAAHNGGSQAQGDTGSPRSNGEPGNTDGTEKTRRRRAGRTPVITAPGATPERGRGAEQ